MVDFKIKLYVFWGVRFCFKVEHYLGLENVRLSAGLMVLGSTLGFQKDGFAFLSSGMFFCSGKRKKKEKKRKEKEKRREAI